MIDMTALLDVSDVTLRYKTSSAVVTATERVSFTVDRSDRFVLLGPSGCGKSTLLKAVGGYMKPSEGKMRISGREISLNSNSVSLSRRIEASASCAAAGLAAATASISASISRRAKRATGEFIACRLPFSRLNPALKGGPPHNGRR